MQRESNLSSLNDYMYSNNTYMAQSKFAEELGHNNSFLVQVMSSAYGFNENLSFIRTKLKKENSKSYLRKNLRRTGFNQNQEFLKIAYKSNTSFVEYQNSVGKGKNEIELSKVLCNAMQLNTEASNNGSFVCAGCRRADTKKYARNLCQTCYKRQRKFQEEGEDKKTIHIMDRNYFYYNAVILN